MKLDGDSGQWWREFRCKNIKFIQIESCHWISQPLNVKLLTPGNSEIALQVVLAGMTMAWTCGVQRTSSNPSGEDLSIANAKKRMQTTLWSTCVKHQRCINMRETSKSKVCSICVACCSFSFSLIFVAFHDGAFSYVPPLRVWLCGGEIYVARDSRVAHVFRRHFPYFVNNTEPETAEAKTAENGRNGMLLETYKHYQHLYNWAHHSSFPATCLYAHLFFPPSPLATGDESQPAHLSDRKPGWQQNTSVRNDAKKQVKKQGKNTQVTLI